MVNKDFIFCVKVMFIILLLLLPQFVDENEK